MRRQVGSGGLNLPERQTRGNCESGTKRSGGGWRSNARVPRCGGAWSTDAVAPPIAWRRETAKSFHDGRPAGPVTLERGFIPRIHLGRSNLSSPAVRGLALTRFDGHTWLYTPVLLSLPGRSRRPSLGSAVNDTATFRAKEPVAHRAGHGAVVLRTAANGALRLCSEQPRRVGPVGRPADDGRPVCLCGVPQEGGEEGGVKRPPDPRHVRWWCRWLCGVGRG